MWLKSRKVTRARSPFQRWEHEDESCTFKITLTRFTECIESPNSLNSSIARISKILHVEKRKKILSFIFFMGLLVLLKRVITDVGYIIVDSEYRERT